MSRLITPSIIGAVDFLRTCPASWKEKAYTDLSNQLNRVYSPTLPPAAALGITFENAVYSMASKNIIDKGSDYFQQCVKECIGGTFQRKTKRFIEVDGFEYCLYGKIDVFFPAIIKDLKTTSNYKGRDSYLSSMQHIIYCFNESINNFRYVVAEFNGDEKSPKIIDVHLIDYVCKDMSVLRDVIIEKIRQFISFLEEDKKLLLAYTNKFSLY